MGDKLLGARLPTMAWPNGCCVHISYGTVMNSVSMSQHPTDHLSSILDLIRTCADGDQSARLRFQDAYGEDIYNFPLKIYGLPEETAGDFYVYVFEKNRIFSRIRTFEGKNNIQFRTFLSFYVLKHLFFEWQRSQKSIDTVSWDTPVGNANADGTGRVLGDIVSEDTTTVADQEAAAENTTVPTLMQALNQEEQLDLKLLTLIECDLTPAEVRLLARIGSRSLADTIALVAEVQNGLKRKDEKISHLSDELDSVWGWILLRQKELQEIDEKILLKMQNKASIDVELLRSQKTMLEHALAKRYRQREKIIAEIRRYKLTTPYKDMAQLLNTTVGTVGSRISRLRERLSRIKDAHWVLEEGLQ